MTNWNRRLHRVVSLPNNLNDIHRIATQMPFVAWKYSVLLILIRFYIVKRHKSSKQQQRTPFAFKPFRQRWQRSTRAHTLWWWMSMTMRTRRRSDRIGCRRRECHWQIHIFDSCLHCLHMCMRAYPNSNLFVSRRPKRAHTHTRTVFRTSHNRHTTGNRTQTWSPEWVTQERIVRDATVKALTLTRKIVSFFLLRIVVGVVTY